MNWNMKIARGEAGLTTTEVAKALGISRVTVNNWECGNTKPTLPDVLMQMADLYGCSVDYLLSSPPMPQKEGDREAVA